jgi:flagellar hook protein FlgE
MVAAKATTKATFEGNLDLAIPKIPAPTAAIVGPPDVPAYPSIDTANKKLVLNPDTKYWETTTTVYDSLGGKHTYKFTFLRGVTSDGTNATAAADNEWGLVIQDQDKGTFFTRTGAPGTPTFGQAMINLKFKTDGTIDTSGTSSVVLQVPAGGVVDPLSVNVDFRKLTQFANESNAAVTSSDGYPQGSLDTFSIGPTGQINGIFTNGMSKIIGQVALAVFKNPAGLEKTAENMFQVTPNSGDPIIGLPGSSGLGSINSGTLEMSNVDISNEFAEMISTQRGFQANSRIITTSDEMLQELVNLKR